ncbi:4-alpha-glucanotransferase [Micropruina sp.]|uniref:4-alpha-glucanotransferase n=1 Tax=Micropruina sp. TaxID=2737536 RepID=UPI0026114796|nr:4-alpha-glucanotransferase [Micropruina sp.]
MALSNPYLAELAAEFGIATEFWDWKGRLTEISDETVIAVLAAMEIDASTAETAAAAVQERRMRAWRRALPPCTVMQQGAPQQVRVHVPDGAAVEVWVRLEDGGTRELRQLPNDEPARMVDDHLMGEASFEVPGDLPPGYHRIGCRTAEWTAEATLIVSPHFLGFPPAMGEKRVWGYATQLYSVRSADSWGIGDLSDLSDLATWSATQQFASYVLVNPLHAAQPMTPLEPSPYLPTSRRYVNPIYIRPEAIAEYATLDERQRARVAQLRGKLAKNLANEPLIKRDQVWRAKLKALRVIFEAGLKPTRLMSLNDFVRKEGRPLSQFATWCALVHEYGMNWREWPVELRRPSSPEVARFAVDHVGEIVFFSWLQWVADEQLRDAQSAAKAAGMRVGIMNDLAVGVSGHSAEAWMLGDTFARGVSVGAPPDHFNQTGQDWGQAPWRPDRLADLSYAPFRNMVAGILRHSGGIRVDHIMGLFRLWWVPEGMGPTHGTYVRYNHEAMVGILVLEAQRAGAVVVGEDLGVVEPWVRVYLRDRGILGTSIAWFERGDDGQILPPESWREYCMASVTTHDLPPTAGYLDAAHVKLQHELGLLTEDLDVELAGAARERDDWLRMLRERGLLTVDDPSTEDIVLAMHRFLVATPARMLCAALTDAVGDHRTQNQPGTVDQYPNWRVPLSGPDGQPMSLEDVFHSEHALRLSAVMNGFVVPPTAHRSTSEFIIGTD